LRLFLGEYGDGQLHSFPAIADSGAQKQRAQMLFDGAWADIKLARNFFVAATEDEQIQNLLIAGCNFDFFDIGQGKPPTRLVRVLSNAPAES
jgi:hypothetical protein